MNIMDRVVRLIKARDRGDEYAEAQLKGALARLRRQTDWMRQLPPVRNYARRDTPEEA